MKINTLSGLLHALVVVVWMSLGTASAQESVPQAQIEKLKLAFEDLAEQSSSARQRLAVKRVIRDGVNLLEAHPTAPNRFEVLGLLFSAQRQLFGLDDSTRNRAALLETSKELVKAPDEYADLRLEADLLLTQIELARKGANAGERMAALKPMVARYVDTPAEKRMLQTAMVMSLEFGDPRLIEDIRMQIAERFAGDHEMIKFQRDKLGGQVFGAPFCGVFKRSDGGVMHLPADTLGKTTILYFWSKEDPEDDHVEQLAAEWKVQKDEVSHRLNIISLNLDQLSDAGEKILRDLGVDWPALHLPGGREHPLYKTFPQRDPYMMTMTPTGYVALIMSGSTRKKKTDTGKTDYARWFQSALARDWSRERYGVQLTSIFAGDFFVVDPEGTFDPTLPPEVKVLATGKAKPLERTAVSVPEETLQAIQDCFFQSPLRYRMPTAELRSAYQKAEELCAKAIADHASAPDLWIVRNRRIVAQLGLWKLTGDQAHYQNAIEESKAAVAAGVERGRDVVARFCLAKEALRSPDAETKKVIKKFVEELGGGNAPGPALAAASLLALDVANRGLHEEYRDLILKKHANDPMMWTFVSFLLDRYHRYWIFRVPFTAGWSYGRQQQWIMSRGHQDEVDRQVNAELQTLDGKPYRLPEDSKGKWSIVLFTNSWVDDKKSPFPGTVTRYLNPYIERRGRDDVQVIVAVLKGEVAPIQAYLKEKPLNCEVLIVPEGISNPIVRQLGILDEDTAVNALLLRPDGSIATSISGLTMSRTKNQLIPNIIDRSDEAVVMALLEKGEVGKAKEYIFKVAPPFDPEAVDEKGRKLKKPVYNHVHLRARAKVYQALGNKEAALADAEEVLEFLTSKGGWMSMRPDGLNEAEALVEALKK